VGGLSNPEEGKFNFKVKIVQTDLASREYLFGAGFGDDFNGDPVVYQNSSYISKLYFINSYSGGILAKDKIEDMPERYRRFIRLDNPTDAEIIKSFKKEMTALANREEIGQNVFYNSLSNPSVYSDSSTSSLSSAPVFPGNKSSAMEYAEHEPTGDFESFNVFECFENLGNFDENGWVDSEDIAEYSEYEENEESGESVDDYKSDEEIKDILFLNNVYNSEMYKMSKVEYDFSVLGNISMTDDGSLNIIYDESEISGLKDSYIQFLFHADNRDIVTIRRKYFFDAWFTLEKGKRVSIERRGRYSGAVSTTSTKELVNNMTIDGGDMRIIYTTETDGAPTESVMYSIHAEPVRN